MMQRYPLQWPAGWKRTPVAARRRAQFSKSKTVYSSVPGSDHSYRQKTELTIAQATTRLMGELRKLGVLEGDAILSTNLRVRLDGLPISSQAQPEDPGVAVYWTRGDAAAAKVMAIDLYDRVEHNIAALAATIEAMRAIERHGGAVILERAFTGFTALPAPGQTTGRTWRDVFGFAHDVTVTASALEESYRRARGKAHPDRAGGSQEAFLEVEAAYEQGCAAIGRGEPATAL
jgi:hypothetical protein